jgi:hypothetical protein
MDRGELEDLDRESLVVRAQAAGIRRARILTRPELIDELLRMDPTADAAQLKKSRGFFGRARDLVARVVERGLHLPDAADRIRTMALGTIPTAGGVPRIEPQAMPTVTLAEIYAAQGHRQRAIETLRRVLEREPDHGAARTLLARLEDEAYVAPQPRLPPEPEIEPELNPSDDEDARSEAPTVETAIAGGRPPIQGPSDSNGDYEFSLAPASDRDPTGSTSVDPAYAETRELPRSPGRTYAFADDVDAHAKTDVFAVVPPRGPVVDPAVAESDQGAPGAAEAPEVEECFAIPVTRDAGTVGAGGRTFVRWSISWSTIGALLGARPTGRFVVRARVVTPAWDGPNTETRDLVVDPDDEQVMLVGLPEPSVVRVAVGWLDGSTFVPIAHSPALEMSRGRGLVIWTTKGAVPVVLDDPRAASIARALAASRVAAQAHA